MVNSMTQAGTLEDVEKEEKLLRMDAVLRRIACSRSTLYRELESGHFPKPLRLGIRGVAWRASDLDRWIAGRAAESQATAEHAEAA